MNNWIGALSFYLFESSHLLTNDDMVANLKKRTLARDYLDSIIESLQEILIKTLTSQLQGIVIIFQGKNDFLVNGSDDLIFS